LSANRLDTVTGNRAMLAHVCLPSPQLSHAGRQSVIMH